MSGDVWVETTAGLIRADKIVHVQVREGKLVVAVEVTAGGSGYGGGPLDFGPNEFTICKVGDSDGGLAAYGLVDFISGCRAKGLRGVITVGKDAELRFDEFDPVDNVV